ncbi:hypothetical protein PV721_36685 [Streptomyces sp. MB09-01]|uniref:hypothetical protein n=1 Tax=Streptomyces sp. MB09-01 TaxID=3028666 RepID=UPI0029BB256A|nr:hypothetical protein [Streptomyces sp. MB09-01]MDX3539765.1 hypothetical protein [Streptomyces sp. MB09-01]
MPILNSTASHEDASSAADSLALLLPCTALLPALASMFADRFSTTGWVVVVTVELALIATTSALAARAAARSAATRSAATDTAAVRARRDAAVLDLLEPLAGERR